ncbi:MAG: DUF6787 family protein [Bacteroidota bacterium]
MENTLIEGDKKKMEEKKKQRPLDYVIILLVFAVTGTTAAIFPRYIMPFTGLAKGTAAYIAAYILLITPIYQVLLLGYAFLFGKFSYFWDKQKKIGKWIADRFRRE